MKDKSIILLSGGVDSAVSLAKCKEEENIELALFFEYGHRAFEQEKISVEKLCKHYGIKLEIIELPWLKNITQTSLVNLEKEVPSINQQELNDLETTIETKQKVWVPNRNGLFINIAGAYADSFGFNKIIIGANKEEGMTFSDNSKEFIERATALLEFSTQVKPKVIAPLIELEKHEIMLLGKKLNLPFELIRSCYTDSKAHCGACESCNRLRRGLERAGLFDIVKLLFKN